MTVASPADGTPHSKQTRAVWLAPARAVATSSGRAAQLSRSMTCAVSARRQTVWMAASWARYPGRGVGADRLRVVVKARHHRMVARFRLAGSPAQIPVKPHTGK